LFLPRWGEETDGAAGQSVVELFAFDRNSIEGPLPPPPISAMVRGAVPVISAPSTDPATTPWILMRPVIFAVLVPYLIVALDAARRAEVAAGPDGVGGQLRVATRVLAAGFAWPRELWRMLRRDWENRSRD
jgi:hypothetical protein